VGLICKRDWEEEYRAWGPALGRRSEPDAFLIACPADPLNQQACIADMHFQQTQNENRLAANERAEAAYLPRKPPIEEDGGTYS